MVLQELFHVLNDEIQDNKNGHYFCEEASVGSRPCSLLGKMTEPAPHGPGLDRNTISETA